MPTLLTARRVEKPWGRQYLPQPFHDPSDGDCAIGEIIFDVHSGSEPQLLVKFLFTSERLSIQVHPDDRLARKSGLGRGKDEAWIVLDAGPASTIGLGLSRPAGKGELREAAIDGRIESMVDWRPVTTGDAYYSPAGTIHAIGAGLSLLEIQQNSDVTYRLYDYGRPRELHLDEALEAAQPERRIERSVPSAIAPDHLHLAGGPAFQVEQLSGEATGRLSPAQGELWLVVLAGDGEVDGAALSGGSVWRVDRPCALRLESGGLAVLAYPGSDRVSCWEPTAA
jgi:mannose-6-phosphate isomerase